jgi:hypothetical protein
MKRAAFPVLLALVALSLSSRAMASLPFSEAIQMQLKLPVDQTPVCTLCHLTLLGGAGTVGTPFGLTAYKKYGLRQLDVAALQNVIAQMQTNGDDSDGDGVGDIAELLQNTDPNVKPGEPPPDPPRYGCYCTTVDARSGFSATGAAWLSGLTLTTWRRRRTVRLRRARQT